MRRRGDVLGRRRLLSAISIAATRARPVAVAAAGEAGQAEAGAGRRERTGLAYDSRANSFDCGYGPGWSDADELPVLSGSNSSLMVRFGAEQADFFGLQGDGSYAAYYGVKDTLVHDTDDNLFLLTKPDGTVTSSTISTSRSPTRRVRRVDTPSGATVVVTDWTTRLDDRIAEVQYETTPDGPPYQEREFTIRDRRPRTSPRLRSNSTTRTRLPVGTTFAR